MGSSAPTDEVEPTGEGVEAPTDEVEPTGEGVDALTPGEAEPILEGTEGTTEHEDPPVELEIAPSVIGEPVADDVPGTFHDDVEHRPDADAARARVLAVFATESLERVKTINRRLMTLERAPDPSSRSGANAFSEILRELHTLKGSSATVHVEPVESLAHQLEALFGAVRDGARKLDAPVFDIAYRALDAVETAVGEAVRGETSGVDTDIWSETIRTAIEQGGSAKNVLEPYPIRPGHRSGGHPRRERGRGHRSARDLQAGRPDGERGRAPRSARGHRTAPLGHQSHADVPHFDRGRLARGRGPGEAAARSAGRRRGGGRPHPRAGAGRRRGARGAARRRTRAHPGSADAARRPAP